MVGTKIRTLYKVFEYSAKLPIVISTRFLKFMWSSTRIPRNLGFSILLTTYSFTTTGGSCSRSGKTRRRFYLSLKISYLLQTMLAFFFISELTVLISELIFFNDIITLISSAYRAYRDTLEEKS